MKNRSNEIRSNEIRKRRELPVKVGDFFKLCGLLKISEVHCFNHKCTLSKAQEHMAEVTTAMLYFACGGMDESHNIVLSHRFTMGPKILWNIQNQ